jgi:hypothetical protein
VIFVALTLAFENAFVNEKSENSTCIQLLIVRNHHTMDLPVKKIPVYLVISGIFCYHQFNLKAMMRRVARVNTVKRPPVAEKEAVES